MKKMMALFLILSSVSAFSGSSFLDHLDGQYKLSGARCSVKDVELTGNALIERTESGTAVRLEAIIVTKTDLSFTFVAGEGERKSRKMEGDIIPLPVARKISWKTDEQQRTSTYSQYEGLVVAKKLGTYTLIQLNSNELVLTIEDGQYTMCKLTKVK